VSKKAWGTWLPHISNLPPWWNSNLFLTYRMLLPPETSPILTLTRVPVPSFAYMFCGFWVEESMEARLCAFGQRGANTLRKESQVVVEFEQLHLQHKKLLLSGTANPPIFILALCANGPLH
jgi:hypothetical protein